MDSLFTGQVWVGRIVSGLAVAFLLFDVSLKLLRLAPAVQGTVELGYPESSVVPIGVILLVGVILYVIPQTTLLGAIYLTGYLGGAVATHYRLSNPLATHMLFPVYVAIFLWGGLTLREPRLLSLLLGR